MRRFTALLCLLPLLANPAWAEDDRPRNPLWEVGIGGGASVFPDYRGARNYSSFGLAGPYGAYRGKRFSIGRDGASASLIDAINAELSLSLATSLPGDADDNPNRDGMPDIDATFELGPSLDFVLSRDATSGWLHKVRIPARAVLATDLRGVDAIGWLIHPNFESSRDWLIGGTEWGLTLSAGPVFATDKYHSYFYDVDPEFARPGRPAFDAGGGYSGARASVIVSWRRGNTRLGVFALYDQLAGASFEDSPLVETHDALIVGIGVARRIWQSDKPAAYDPLDVPPAPPGPAGASSKASSSSSDNTVTPSSTAR